MTCCCYRLIMQTPPQEFVQMLLLICGGEVNEGGLNNGPERYIKNIQVVHETDTMTDERVMDSEPDTTNSESCTLDDWDMWICSADKSDSDSS